MLRHRVFLTVVTLAIIASLVTLTTIILAKKPADFDGNGVVDFSDFLLLVNALDQTDSASLIYDLNGDGVVDQHDFSYFRARYGSIVLANTSPAISLGDITNQSAVKFDNQTFNANSGDAQYFSFSLTETKRVSIGLRQLDYNADLYLEDSSYIVMAESVYSNTSDEWIDEKLSAGTYYIRVQAWETGLNEYKLRYGVRNPRPLVYTPSGALYQDIIGDITNLLEIEFRGYTFKALADSSQYVSFSLTESADVTLGLSKLDVSTDLYLLDSQETKIDNSREHGTGDEHLKTSLDAGDYIIQIQAKEAGLNQYRLTYGVEASSSNEPPLFSAISFYSEDSDGNGALYEHNELAAYVDISDPNEQDRSSLSLEMTGDDADHFAINYDGGHWYIKAKTAPYLDYERPVDSDTDNVYDIQLTISSGTESRLLTFSQDFPIPIIDFDREKPDKISGVEISSISSNGFDVSWETPATKGPDITSYNVSVTLDGSDEPTIVSSEEISVSISDLK